MSETQFRSQHEQHAAQVPSQQGQRETRLRLQHEARIRRQHEAGKLTARERLAILLDKDSFHETGLPASPSEPVMVSTDSVTVSTNCSSASGTKPEEFPSDGVVTGYGLIGGRKVFVYAQDYTFAGGTLGKKQAAKICRIMERAREEGASLIGINDSGGARIQEGVDALSGCGELFRNHVLCSGKIPQITLIMGPCAGAAAYAPALTDIVLMTEHTGRMFCTGPAVLPSVTYEEVDGETLGGAMTHAMISGEVHLTAPDDEALLIKTRQLLSYLPSTSDELPPIKPWSNPKEELPPAMSWSDLKELPPAMSRIGAEKASACPDFDSFLPESGRIPYDMKDLIRLLADKDSFFELQPLYADNLITAFIRIAGRVVGVIANQPIVMAGCLDINAADKGARFVHFCSTFHIPLLSLVDVPGFLPGVTEEHGGILRYGAKLLYAFNTFNTAEVPLVTLLVRKAYGGAYIAMGSKECGADLVFSWPAAEIAVMGAEAAVEIIYRKELAKAEDPAAEKKRLADEYNQKYISPGYAAGKGYIDKIIEPKETRKELAAAFSRLAAEKAKRKRPAP